MRKYLYLGRDDEYEGLEDGDNEGELGGLKLWAKQLAASTGSR